MAIIITGETGVGKSTVGQILAKKINYKLYEIGHLVKKSYYDYIVNSMYSDSKMLISREEYANRLIFQNRKDNLTRNRLSYVADIVRKEGSDYFIKKLLDMHNSEQIIIVGVRSNAELDTISARLNYPFVVALTCDGRSQEHRFVDREKNNMENYNAKKIFNKRIDVEKNWGVNNIIGRCDMVISTTNMYPESIAEMILQEYDRYLYDLLCMEGMKGNAKILVR